MGERSGTRNGAQSRSPSIPAFVIPSARNRANSAWTQEGGSMRLQDKVILVTGAASGMGRAGTRMFAEQGARVIGAPNPRGRFGKLNVLYNNAGIMPDEDTSVVATDEAVWERVLDVNLKSIYLCCKHGIPALQAAGGGSLVNIPSFVA